MSRPANPSTICLLTDFGLKDHYVGTMKGVLRNHAPQAHLVDLSHDVPAGHIRAGSFLLRSAYQYFPEGTVYLVVIDPGVGTSRDILAARAHGQYFIAPDNGVLSSVLDESEAELIVHVTDDSHFLKPVSNTFHGRDIFAPLAACVANGVALKSLGDVAREIIHLPHTEPELTDGQMVGHVQYVDHFGNAITNIAETLINQFCTEQGVSRGGLTVKIKAENGSGNGAGLSSTQPGIPRGYTIHSIADTYARHEANQPIALIGSTGYLEIALNQGNAAEYLKLEENTQVMLLG